MCRPAGPGYVGPVEDSLASSAPVHGELLFGGGGSLRLQQADDYYQEHAEEKYQNAVVQGEAEGRQCVPDA